METIKIMLSVLVRMLPCRRCCSLYVLLLSVVSAVAVEITPASDVLSTPSYAARPLYGTATRSHTCGLHFCSMPTDVSPAATGSPTMVTAAFAVQKAGAAAHISSSRIRLSEIGAPDPYSDISFGQETRKPFRVSINDNIGDPGAVPAGEIPFVLMLLLCGVWMLLRRRKTL